ncbi:site-specific integrase [Caballeronia sp. SEWSISQ10-4 2]|uniref:site-specific integrase n=1 Tax=Caballeronia sp. SEWSISQ10-4 2 TaxID=2937438 RepID=UPI002650D30C|nr:site-specific integrase [Caballeronia sp. SEWSISQ10-4 2]MDN7177314.1 site-specific integrase [Caballeronia sp. SEWSISQ10-4 2]
MASFQTRNGSTRSSTRAIIRKVGHTVITASFDTETEARDWAARTEARMAAGLVADPGPVGPNTSTRDLIDRYLAEYALLVHKSYDSTRSLLTGLYGRFDVFEKPICKFGQDEAQACIDGRLRGDKKNGHHFKPVSAGTVLRECGALSGFFDWVKTTLRIPLAVNPMTLVHWPVKPNHRTQRANESQLDLMLGALGYVRGTVPETSKEWVGWCTLFAVETALRQGNILAMRCGDVFAKHVHVEMTKNGHPHDAPLSSRARALLALLPRGNDHERTVPVNASNFGKIWRAARAECGLEKLRFHDLRREATSRAAKVYHNELELAKYTGHRDLKSLMTYYAPDVNDMADALG